MTQDDYVRHFAAKPPPVMPAKSAYVVVAVTLSK
jgi:hypothetical protein